MDLTRCATHLCDATVALQAWQPDQETLRDTLRAKALRGGRGPLMDRRCETESMKPQTL